MNPYLLHILLFLTGGTSPAPVPEVSTPADVIQIDPETVKAKLREFYSEHTYIYQELSYQLYPTHHSTIPQSSETGIFIKNGDTQYSRLASIESLTTKAYTIGIDNDEKFVMISNLISLPPTGTIANHDEWIDQNSTLKVSAISDQLSALSSISEFGEIEEAKIIYRNYTYQPVKIILKYRKSIQLSTEDDASFTSPLLEIQYLKTSFDAQGKDQLDLNTYVIKKGNQWVLSSKYQGYELITNINELPNQN